MKNFLASLFIAFTACASAAETPCLVNVDNIDGKRAINVNPIKSIAINKTEPGTIFVYYPENFAKTEKIQFESAKDAESKYAKLVLDIQACRGTVIHTATTGATSHGKKQ